MTKSFRYSHSLRKIKVTLFFRSFIRNFAASKLACRDAMLVLGIGKTRNNYHLEYEFGHSYSSFAH